MKSANYSVTIQEFRAAAIPGRTPLIKACTALVAVLGVVVLAVVGWAQFSFYDLNELPWPPRLILAALVVAASMAIYKSIREVEVPLTISFYQDRLVLEHERHPTLWREGEPPMTTAIRYKDITGCTYSPRRMRLTFRTKGYTQKVGEGPVKQKSGTFEFSTLKAPDVNFARLVEKHSPLKAVTKT